MNTKNMEENKGLIYTHSVKKLEDNILQGINKEDPEDLILEEVEDLIDEIDNILDCLEDKNPRKIREALACVRVEMNNISTKERI